MAEAEPKIYCANHPNIETTLRCNRCEKPICTRCAILTPTGYRCRECVKGQQKVFETAELIDYPLVFIVVMILTLIGSAIATRIGFFTILLAPFAGGVIAEAARRVTRKRRSRKLFLTAAVAAVVGCLPFLLLSILNFNLYGLIFQAVYAFLVVSTMYARLAGIKIG